MKKLVQGINDLKTKFPSIAAEAHGWDPSLVLPGSHKQYQWKCKKGHNWKTRVGHRTSSKSSCPYCANKKVLRGFNDLKTKFPSIAAEAYGWDPSLILPGCNQRKKWKCELGHEWDTSVNKRTQPEGTNCPYCTNQKVLAGF